MARKYKYRALDQTRNKIVNGTVEAVSDLALEEYLSDSNLALISFREIKPISFLNLSAFSKITSKDLITFFIHLEQLEKAGVPLLESLSDLKEYSENQKIKDVTADIFESVKSGKLMSEAMERHPKIFTEVMISLVRIGEKTGGLQVAFKNIYENIKWAAEIRRKTMKAIRYPLFSLLVMFVVAVIMLKVVVPKVTGFILDQGITVPIYTKALIATSNFFQNNFFKLISIIAGFFIGLQVLSRNETIKLRIDKIKLKIPVIGQIIKKIEMSKFTKYFGITFSSGVPVLECLDVSSNVIENLVIKDDVKRIREEVSNGKSVSNALATSIYFPNMILRMFKVGEESGNMGDAMKNIEYFYETEINDSIDDIIGTLQPAIMFFMGGLMIWVIVGVFGPIYSNFSNFGA